MSIGSRVKELRKAQKMTQIQLASKANMSRSYLADLEGDRYNPSLNTLQAIAVALNVELAEIIKHSDSEMMVVGDNNTFSTVLKNKEKTPLEKEFLENVVKLSDKEVQEGHTFMIDDRELTEEEFHRMIAAVRADRLYKDQQ